MCACTSLTPGFQSKVQPDPEYAEASGRHDQATPLLDMDEVSYRQMLSNTKAALPSHLQNLPAGQDKADSRCTAKCCGRL